MISIEKLESMLRDLDWKAIHWARISDYFGRVEFHLAEDGESVEFHEMEQNTYFQYPNLVGSLNCWRIGSLALEEYYYGWAWEQEDGNYMTDDGRVLTESEMIQEAIEEGDWDYDCEIDEILDQYRYNQLEG